MFGNAHGICDGVGTRQHAAFPRKRRDLRSNADLLHSADVRSADSDEEDVPKLSSGNADDAARVLGQNADLRPQTQRIDLVVVARDLLPPFDDPLDGRVVAVIVLRRQAEAGDSAVSILLADGLVLHEVADRKVFAFDPDGGCLGEGVIDDRARVRDDDGFGLGGRLELVPREVELYVYTYRIMFLVYWPGPCLVFADEEFLEILQSISQTFLR